MATINNNSNETMKVNVQSPNIRYTDETIEADYEYDNVKCIRDEKTNSIKVNDSLFLKKFFFHLNNYIILI